MKDINIPDRWSFDAPSVAEGFDRHVRAQLPFYDLATKAVVDLTRLHLSQFGLVYDLGASTGNIARALAELLHERNALIIGLEESPEMCARYNGPGDVVEENLLDYEPAKCDVAISFLTLAFLPVQHRATILERWLDAINPGGAFIAVERMDHRRSPLAARYLIQAAKLRAGETDDDVIAKEVSIGGVLRPLADDFFSEYGGWCFFTYGDFRGYVIEVPE